MQLSCEEDMISKLPDDILVDILSSLTIKQAAQTSVLSHRWLDLWMHVPLLQFDGAKVRLPKNTRKKEMRSYVNWVNHVLQLHRSSDLREFRICFDLDKIYQSEIDKWLEYAFANRAKRLELNLNPVGRYRDAWKDNYVFPTQLFDQAGHCGMHIAGKVNFSCLKILRIRSINISGEAVECLLRKCTLLEELRMFISGTFTNLVISGPSLVLKHLEIYCCCFVSFTISNLNLVSLSLNQAQRASKTGSLVLNNLPMLTEVHIIGSFFNSEKVIYSHLSCCLSQLTVLTIPAVSSENILNLHQFRELRNLRRLVLILSCNILDCKISAQCLIGLTSWIKACPRLLEFALRHDVLDYEMPYGEKNKVTGESLRGLKVMELHGYQGYENEIELITFLVNNAVALEKIVIDPHELTHRYAVGTFSESDRVRTLRRHAMEKIGALVPEHVQLSIL